MPRDFYRCNKCSYESNEVIRRCPTCGRATVSSKRLRRLGWAQLLLGLVIVGLMGTVTFYVAPIMLQPQTAGSSTRFTGTAEQAQAFLLLFGVVIMFGLIRWPTVAADSDGPSQHLDKIRLCVCLSILRRLAGCEIYPTTMVCKASRRIASFDPASRFQFELAASVSKVFQ